MDDCLFFDVDCGVCGIQTTVEISASESETPCFCPMCGSEVEVNNGMAA